MSKTQKPPKTPPLTEGKTMGSMCPKNVSVAALRPQSPPPSSVNPPPFTSGDGELVVSKFMSEREKQWIEFSDRVAKHLREYTVPQYGDVGEDEITGYTIEDCVNQVSKYTKRYGSQSRDGQQELDFVKMAHYIQCAWEKYGNLKEVNETDDLMMASYDYIPDLECVFTGEDDNGRLIHVYKGRLR